MTGVVNSSLAAFDFPPTMPERPIVFPPPVLAPSHIPDKNPDALEKIDITPACPGFGPVRACDQSTILKIYRNLTKYLAAFRGGIFREEKAE